MKKTIQQGRLEPVNKCPEPQPHMPDDACEPVQLPLHSKKSHNSTNVDNGPSVNSSDNKLNETDHTQLYQQHCHLNKSNPDNSKDQPEMFPETLPTGVEKSKLSSAKVSAPGAVDVPGNTGSQDCKKDDKNEKKRVMDGPKFIHLESSSDQLPNQGKIDSIQNDKLTPKNIVLQDDEDEPEHIVLQDDENEGSIPFFQNVDSPHQQDRKDIGAEVTPTAYKVSEGDIETQVSQAVQKKLDEAPVAQVVKRSRWKVLVWIIIIIVILAVAVTVSFVLVNGDDAAGDTPVYCSLCYSYRESEVNTSETFFSPGITCENMSKTLETKYNKDDPSCLLEQTLAFTKCGCPELPPPSNSTNRTCSLCVNGGLPSNPDNLAFSDYTQQGTNLDPAGYNMTHPYLVRMTCSALDTYLSYVSHSDLEREFGECSDYQVRDAINCGCEDSVNGCLTSVAAYNFAEYALQDDRENRYYTFCPNTTYITDSVLDDGTIIHPPMKRIIILHSNVHLKCGEDGSSTNNCTISGGGGQLLMMDQFLTTLFGPETDITLQNIFVEGLTFTQNIQNLQSHDSNVFVHGVGDITFHDCVFADNQILNRGRAILFLQAEDFGDILTNSSRSLLVKVDGCTFRDNVLGIQPEENGQEALPSSLINSDDVEILITNSLFENNENAAIPPTMRWNVCLVDNFAGVLKLVGNCFIDNGVTIAPVINQVFGEVVESHSNFVQGSNTSVKGCDFIANMDDGKSTWGTPIESLSYSCVDHDLVDCPLATANNNSNNKI